MKKAFNLNFSTFFTPKRTNPRDSVPLVAECDYELTTGIQGKGLTGVSRERLTTTA